MDGNLRRIFREHLPSIHWLSVETSLTEPGVPDMNGCYNGNEFWIENKVTSGWKVKIRPEQIGWTLRRIKAGGRVFVAVRRKCSVGQRRIAADELWLYRGSNIVTLSNEGLKMSQPLGRWEGGPKCWAWDRVRALLLDRYI